MTCSHELLQAWLDEELDAAQAGAVEQHVAKCAECAGEMAQLRRQRAEIRAAAPYYNAPGGQRDAVTAALRGRAERERRAAGGWAWRWVAVAACVLLAASATWNVARWRAGTAENTVADAVLSNHIRSLLAAHLVDVPSSDQHTVKPWFAGKLDFAPVVKDLAGEGFPLEGGRMEYLDGRRVAALVYRRRQHVINLFTWPAEKARAGETRVSRDGYNLLEWTDGPMRYWAVTDAARAELERFGEAYRK